MKVIQFLFLVVMCSQVKGADNPIARNAEKIKQLKIERKQLVKQFFDDDFDSYDQIVGSLVLNRFRLIMLDSTIRISSVLELEQKKVEREQRAVALQRARERFRQQRCKKSFLNLLLIV